MINLEPSDEQILLKDSVDRFVERDYAFDVRRKAAASEEGFRRDTWKRFADLGWLAVGLPERDGGTGDARDVAVVMESFGRGLVVEPLLSCVVMAARAVALAGDGAQRSELLSGVVAGDLLMAFAHAEPRARYDLAHVATRAQAPPARTGC